MLYFIPTIFIFLIESYLLLSWWQSRRQKDGKDKTLCFWGFLLGELYLMWEVLLVKQTGQPLPNSTAQKMLMARILLGGSWGGLFTVIGLFYLSFASFGQLNQSQDPPE